MKSDRYFYSTAAAINLLIVVIGFLPFYLRGHGDHERVVSPDIFRVVVVHGLAITLWYVLSLIQSLLITVKNRRLHMRLGWAAVALVPIVAVSGVQVAIRSARAAGAFEFFGMDYSNFLLVMLTEMTLFTVFVLLGLSNRTRPALHRVMMLLASLTMVPGGAVRIHAVVDLFGGDRSRVAFFGPLVALAVGFVLLRWILSRSFDACLARGLAVLLVLLLGAEQLSRTHAWQVMATGLLKTS